MSDDIQVTAKTSFAILCSLASVLVAAAEQLRWFSVPTTSMEPTILRGDHVAVDETSYRSSRPARGDIVSYKNPLSPETALVKRIVALPLETVEIRHKQLFVNGRPLEEPYVVHRDERDYSGASTEPYKSRDSFGPISLALTEYFVLGDNRDSSMDSRYHGAVSGMLVIGKVIKIRGSAGTRAVP